MSKIKTASGRLLAEVRNALGLRLLAVDKTPPAIRMLRLALLANPKPALRNTIRLHIGECQRQRGNYRTAMFHFKHVIKHGAPALQYEAHSRAGQMAIEFRRYEDARHHFEAQLVTKPLGPQRQAALWGLGWVAFRSQKFQTARRFFLSLLAERPFGPQAPASIYWAARAAQETHERLLAHSELLALIERFPVDYYAYRAHLLVDYDRKSGIIAQRAALPKPRDNNSVSYISSLAQADLTQKTWTALREVIPYAGERYSPGQRSSLRQAAIRVQAPRLAGKLLGIQTDVFPDWTALPSTPSPPTFPLALSSCSSERVN